MASVAASMATARFNQLRLIREAKNGGDLVGSQISQFPMAMFDARVFQIPFAAEVENYFIWRQQDATRNSISSAAQSVYSSKELHGVKTDGMQEMLFQKGINWNNYSPREKRGSVIRKVEKQFVRRETMAEVTDTTVVIPESATYKRNVWEADQETPIFTQDREYLRNLMPITDKKEYEQ
jgi:tRNA(His) 5'-end guanylyltransferase